MKHLLLLLALSLPIAAQTQVNGKGGGITDPAAFRTKLGFTATGSSIATMPAPGNDMVLAWNGSGVLTPVTKASLGGGGALDLAAAYNWTGTHTFTNSLVANGGASLSGTVNMNAGTAFVLGSGVAAATRTTFGVKTPAETFAMVSGDIVIDSSGATTFFPGAITNIDINASAAIALSKTNISLTTTGSSGAATLNTTSGVLNIPQYSGGGPMDFDALTAATEADIDADDLFAVSHDGTEKGITLDNLIDLLEAQVWTFSEMNITTANVGTMVFEGATADASETTIAVTDPTADRTVTLRDASGTVILSGDTFTGDVTATLDTDGGTALTIEDSVTVTGWSMGASTATTPSADDSDTSLATTAFVQGELPGTQTSTHASPATGAQSPTWTGAMHTVWHGATSTVNLPAASGYTGRGLMVYNTGAFTITIEPNGSEIIVRDGTAQTGGVNFTLASGAGNFVALISDGARWITLGYKGTLTAGS